MFRDYRVAKSQKAMQYGVVIISVIVYWEGLPPGEQTQEHMATDMRHMWDIITIIHTMDS